MKISDIVNNKHFCLAKSGDYYVLLKYANGIKSNPIEVARNSNLDKVKKELTEIVAHINKIASALTVIIYLDSSVSAEDTVKKLQDNQVGTDHRKSGVHAVTFKYESTDKKQAHKQLQDICKELNIKAESMAVYDGN